MSLVVEVRNCVQLTEADILNLECTIRKYRHIERSEPDNIVWRSGPVGRMSCPVVTAYHCTSLSLSLKHRRRGPSPFSDVDCSDSCRRDRSCWASRCVFVYWSAVQNYRVDERDVAGN